MKLNCKKVEYFEVDYLDLEDFIQKVYNRPNWDFVESMGCRNDSEHSFCVKKNSMNKWAKADIERNMGGVYDMLNDLADRDLIEEGNYLIRVCW